MTTGKKIELARRRCCMNQSELAAKIGVDQSAISRYENDSTSVTLEILDKIAEALNCSTKSLIGGRNKHGRNTAQTRTQ